MKTTIRPETEMKDSGIKWVGLMPVNWKTVRIKNLPNQEENSFVDGDWIESSYITDSGIRYYTTGNIGDGKFKEQGNGYISENTFNELKCKYAFPGDLVLSRLNEPYGRSCIIPETEPKCIVAVDNVILRTNEDKRYICYITQCDGYHAEVGELARGTAMKRVSRTNLGTIRIPLPAKIEQQAIANYLDQTCSKIDEIITEAKASIDEYKKLKQSVITNITTHGLRDVSLINSGNMDIGMIPDTWSICKTLYGLAMPITDGPHVTPELLDDGIAFISAEAVSCGRGSIDFNHMRGYISEEFYNECCKKYVPQRDDIYMIKSGATTGTVSIVDTDRKFTIWSPLAVFRVNRDRLNPRYLFYFLQSKPYQQQVQLGWTFGTQQNIGMRTLEQLKICLPPLGEQAEIVEYLDNKLPQIDSLIAEKESLINDLEVYKKSLIYEVVTGKRRVV